MRNSLRVQLRVRIKLLSIVSFEVVEIDKNNFYFDFNQLYLSGWPKLGNVNNIKVTISIFTG